MCELDVATAAARKAGAYIREQSGIRPESQMKLNPSDLVTIVDKTAERLIREEIASAFPDHAILGEEEGGAPDADWVWIVDPLDGTLNFIQTLPFFAVSIALAHKGEVQVGVVYDPIREELFAAARGRGATLNGQPIQVDPSPSLADAIVSTRTPRDYQRDGVQNLAAYTAVARRSRAMRSLGAAALELAWVAAGRISAFWEMILSPWDWAAGALLVVEAGGRVTAPLGEELPTFDLCGVMAANPAVHAELLATVRENQAE
jgi:myo-inositol-1(or 4)-monophosphatase